MQVPYTNNAKHAVHIGSKRIDPGQTRMVDETLVPGYKPAAPAGADQPDELLELLEGSIKEIEGQLSDLSLEDIARLEEAERNGKTRKGLLEAIELERLARADADLSNEDLLAKSPEEIIALIQDPEKVSDEQLIELHELEGDGQNREAVLEAIAAEDSRRTAV